MSASKEHALVELDDASRDAAVGTLRMLADGTRLALLWHLRDGELTVTDLARLTGRPTPAVSQHLAKLRLGGLVRPRREGTQIHYRLATSHVRQLVDDVVAHTQHGEDPS
ncbi:MAG TPA: metalloregulator ArsR/SmtB family transcription factor [Dermatophilaceae bacterium]|nr:metalloregulator ArsR/SmtB family transcription factor [Dermatophilaceae bacterium]